MDIQTRIADLRSRALACWEASEMRRSRLEELKEKWWFFWIKPDEDSKVRALYEESEQCYREADALTPKLIRTNLKRFGIEDMTVTGILYLSDNRPTPTGGVHFREGPEVGRVKMLLSDLCGLRFSGLAEKFGVGPRDVSFRVKIKKEGKFIGWIDSDGDFDYKAAPDLRTALGWKIATDGGREYLIDYFDLDQATKSILETIRSNGKSKKAFFGPFFEAIQRVFVSEWTSRFGDGYCGAAPTIWRVATRELGEEHRGYTFWY
jgi:hypothetical protein